MWIWEQLTGCLIHSGRIVGKGYSGHGAGANNPAAQHIRNMGPLPAGRWTILGPPTFSKDHGPYVLRLMPEPGTETFGRSGFLIHGDSIREPGTASRGCIVLPRSTRILLWDSGDRDLEVVARIPPEVNIA